MATLFPAPKISIKDVPQRIVLYDLTAHSPLACSTFAAGRVGGVRDLIPCLVGAQAMLQSGVVTLIQPLGPVDFQNLGLGGPGI